MITRPPLSLLRLIALCIATLACSLLPDSASAANATWNGSIDNDWAKDGNWSAVAPTTGNTATFAGSPANQSVVVDSGRAVGSINFNSTVATNFIIGSSGGNTLTLGNGGNITYSAVSGTNLTQSVNAPLSLGGTYTFTNSNTDASNLLSFGGAISSTTGLTVNGTGNTKFNGNLSLGTALLTKSGTGHLEFAGTTSGLGRLNISAGNATISGGTFTPSTPNQNFVGVAAGSTLNITGGTVNISAGGGNAFGGNGAVLQTGGSVNLSGGTLYASPSFGGVVADYTITGGSFSMDSSTSMRGVRNFTVGGNATANIVGTTNLRISDSAVANLTLQDTAAMTFSGSPVLVQTSGGSGTVNLNGGTLTIPGLGAGNADPATTSLIAFNGGTLRFSAAANISLATNVKNITVGNNGAKIDTNGFNITLARALDANGTGGLTKNGAGTLTLGSASSYTGETRISAGTILLNSTGTINSSSGVNILSGATFNIAAKTGYTVNNLRGAGLVTGASGQALTLAGTGALAPGDLGVGTLSIGAGNLTLTTGSTFELEIGGTTGSPTNDSVVLTGSGSNVSLTGNYTLELANLGTVDPTGLSFVLFDATSAIAAPGTWSFDYGTTGWSGGSVGLSGGNVILSGLSTVPEPRAGALLTLALTSLVLRRRRS